VESTKEVHVKIADETGTESYSGPVAERLKAAVEEGVRDPEQLKRIKKRHSSKGSMAERMSKLVRDAPRVSMAGPGKRTTIALMPTSGGAVIPAGYENSCLSRGPFRSKIEFEKIDDKIRKGRWMIHLLSDNDEDITFESLKKGGPQMLITCHNEVHHGEYDPNAHLNEPEEDDKHQMTQNVQMAAASKVKACPFCGVTEPVDAVDLACGHSFCRAHLGDMLRTWQSSGIYTCPKCGEIEPQPDVLQLHSRQFDNKTAMTNDIGRLDMSFGTSSIGPRGRNEQTKTNKSRSQPQQGRPSARRR
jgi:hypothetical protein